MRRYKFSNAVDIISGGTPKTSVPEYWNGNIPWLSVVDFGNKNKYVYDTEKTITMKGVENSSTTVLKAGDIIISARGTVGALAVLAKPMAFNQSCFGLRAKTDLIDQSFLFYYLKGYMNNLKAKTQGSVFSTINLATFDMLEINCPELPMQKYIAKVLSDIDDKIETNDALASKLESLARMIYDYWFLQFDFPDEKGRPYRSSGGKMVWNAELKREIPEGWEVDRLGKVITTERGISYNTQNIKSGEGVPMLNLATFRPGGGAYKADGLKHFKGEYPEGKILKPYELIMCNTQQTAINFPTDIIGRAMLVPDIFDGDVVSSHHVNVIRTANPDLRFYLLYLFNSDFYHKYISGFTNGTNILGLLFNGVEDYKTEIPPAKLLKKFAAIVMDVEKQKNEIIKENRRLVSLRDFLLPLLMNGQVTFK